MIRNGTNLHRIRLLNKQNHGDTVGLNAQTGDCFREFCHGLTAVVLQHHLGRKNLLQQWRTADSVVSN
jgi:hypothetical protein